MPRHYDIAATVRALAPVLRRGGFRQMTHRPGLLGTPKYNGFGDSVVFEKGERSVKICVDRGEVYLILISPGEEPTRPDLDCPHDMGEIGGVACMPLFTDATINCLTAKLQPWM